MVRSMLAGGLALIVLYVVVQQGTSSKVEASSNVVVGAIKRFLSPGVAGVGQHRGPSSTEKKTEPPVTKWRPGMEL